MPNDKYKKLPRHTTPVGTAVFPRLTTPDFKFKKDHGEFSVKLRLTEAEAKTVLAKADVVAEESFKEKQAEYAGKKDKKNNPIVVEKAEPSYAVELDDNQQPTGMYLINFKMSGGWTDKKTGEKKTKSVPHFDAAGKALKGVDVWGGSRIKVAYELAPYFTEAEKKAGVSFRMLAVQVIELVSKGSGTAEQFGFAKEQGYQQPEEETFEAGAAPATEVAADAKNGKGGNF